jgi:HEAT repeat protein
MKLNRASIYILSIVLLGGVSLVAVNLIRSQVERVMSERSAPANETQSQKVKRLVKNFKQGNPIFAIPAAIELTDEFRPIKKSPELKKIAESTVPELIPVLSDTNPGIQLYTIQILGSMGESAQAAIPPMLPFLKDPNEAVRSSTVEALGEMGAAAKSAIPQIMPLLSDGSGLVRRSSVQALGHLGQSAKSAVPQIIPLLQDSDYYVRYYTISAIGEIGDSAELLIPFLKDPDSTMRTRAILALSNKQALSSLTIPQLLALLKESDLEYRAQEELNRRGYKPSSVVDHRP